MDAATFANMGGYALHVWGAYGLGLAGFVGILVHAVTRLDRLRKTDVANNKDAA